MFRKIKEMYPQNNQLLYILFDFSFTLYLIAYFVYNSEGELYSIIRLVATLLLLSFGTIISLLRLRHLRLYTIWYSLFCLFGIFSILWADNDVYVMKPMTAIIRIIIISCFLYARVKTKRDIELVLNSYIVMTIYLSVYALMLTIKHFGITEFYLYRLGMYDGYNPNSIAICIATSILILIYKLKKVKVKFIQRHIILALIIVMSLLLIVTGSKKGILGLVLGILLITYIKSSGVKKLRQFILAIISVILLLQLVMNVPFLYEIIGYRLESILSAFNTGINVDVSTQNRIDLIKVGLSMWLDNPLVGVGLNNFSIYQNIGGVDYYSHCNYIEMLADLGILGFALYYSLPSMILLKKIVNKDELLITLKAICIMLLFMEIGMVSYHEIGVQLFYCVFCIAQHYVALK